MSDKTEGSVCYFSEKGPVNTEKALNIAVDAAEQRGISQIVVATSSGETALKARELAENKLEIIAVTYGAGTSYTKEVARFNKNQDDLRKKGIHIVRGLHAFSGVEKGIANRYQSTLIPLNIIADTLRMFSQGVKVGVEISVMAAEQGLITPENDVVVVGGSGHGADTAMVIKPAFASTIFETKIKAILCMPV